MSIEERIVADLAPLDVPVFEQGNPPDDVGTDGDCVTYYPVDAPDVAHYDNMPACVEHQMQVNIYSADPSRVEELRKKVSDLLLAAHWTRDGRGYADELNDQTMRHSWHMVFYLFMKED